ncbi:AbrB/MazE/SpoVT family DNA-binding domain-containing protein [Candidatus Bathyarchaeota archaeon]|nr:AbrB/MazE/SpoVT family DNA-binding domain-containing protein [Candidatus Bathyarchaeota archaeon]
MKKEEIRCAPTISESFISCCKLQALVSIDERGQMILPKDVREKAEIKPGDKLAIVSSERDGKIYCISLIKAEEFKESIKKAFGPMLEELFR